MQFDKRERALLIFLVCTIFFFGGLLWGRVDGYPDSPYGVARQQGQQAGNEGEKWGSVADWTTIFLTVAVAVATFVLTRRANKTSIDALNESRKATQQATRNADAYIESERGRLAHLETRATSRTVVEEDGKLYYVTHFAFHNVGKGMVSLIEFAHDYKIEEKPKDGLKPIYSTPHTLKRLNLPVPAGLVLTTHPTEHLDGFRFGEGSAVMVTEEEYKRFEGKTEMRIQYRVRYIALSGLAYQLRFTISKVKVENGEEFRPEYGDLITNEKRWIRLSDLRRTS